jgi:LysR family transcriptional regulator, glycine cleavage system transcriptional activator
LKKRLPPLQSLLAFEATARLGVLSRAADELALTQSAISHQIQNLEEWVGQPLFRRIGRGVQLTAAGELFSSTVNATLKALWDGRERIEPYRNMDSVIIACPAEFASGWLIPRLSLLKETYPHLQTWLITQEEITDIDGIDVDLIVTNTSLESAKLTAVKLLDDEAIAVCGLKTYEQLANCTFPDLLSAVPLIMDEQRLEWAPWLVDYPLLNTTLKRAITIDDVRLQLAAAKQELGIAMVSQVAAGVLLNQGKLSKLNQIPSFTLPNWWLMKSKLKVRTPATDIVFNWLVHLARENI